MGDRKEQTMNDLGFPDDVLDDDPYDEAEDDSGGIIQGLVIIVLLFYFFFHDLILFRGRNKHDSLRL